MILERLTLENFGLFRGPHTIELAPPSADRPIVLVGGLNGSGKTTLLDALQLVLFGKQANCSNRGTLSYSEFLARSIHRSTDPRGGAALKLSFRLFTDGVERIYRLHRHFRLSGAEVAETVEVFRDDQFDPMLTERWQEQVEELIPSRLADLFFFDGDRIEGLADVGSSAALLQRAVQSLLGLDLVDRLAIDLSVLEKKKKLNRASESDRVKVEEAGVEIADLERHAEELLARAAEFDREMENYRRRLDELDARYHESGGSLYERRKDLESQQRTIGADVTVTEDLLRDLCAGATPLLLIRGLLNDLERQDDVEQRAEEAQSVAKLLLQRDHDLYHQLSRIRAPQQVVDEVERFLTNDRAERIVKTASPAYLKLSSAARRELRILVARSLEEHRAEGSALCARYDDLKTSLDEIERTLETIPEPEALVQLIEARAKARASLKVAIDNHATAQAEYNRVRQEIEAKRHKQTALIERLVESDFASEDGGRVVQHAMLSRQTLEKFRVAVVNRHSERLGSLILEGFRKLHRKASLIASVRVNPNSFRVEFVHADGSVVLPERLSAGERQLLACSMLWALARASGRPLPVVIDTPLGRLDGRHRGNLVKHYYPLASHQVILLSTDKEIDADLYDELRPSIGRAYHLRYDDATKSSVIEQGYLW